MDITRKSIVLSLNAVWQKIGCKTVKQAVCDMASGSACGMDITYEMEDGQYNFTKPISVVPVNWDEWITLPVRSYDFYINTAKLKIRAPTVIVCTGFNKMPVRTLRPTKQAIISRDSSTCQYTGRKLNKSQITLDHVLPQARGGKDSWTNLVVCDKDINLKKGHKTNDEAGLKLIRQPKAPLPIPVSELIKEIKARDWALFV